MKRLIVWYNPHKKEYYYKVVRTHYIDYYVGVKNSYDHEVVLVIHDLIFDIKKKSHKERFRKKLIRFLDKN